MKINYYKSPTIENYFRISLSQFESNVIITRTCRRFFLSFVIKNSIRKLLVVRQLCGEVWGKIIENSLRDIWNFNKKIISFFWVKNNKIILHLQQGKLVNVLRGLFFLSVYGHTEVHARALTRKQTRNLSFVF